MKVLHWNISYNANADQIYSELQKYASESFVCILLEVLPKCKEKLEDLFGDSVNLSYSLDYRIPGKFDAKNRIMGVLLLTSKDISIIEASVFNRSIFPDRTIWARLGINMNGNVDEIRIAGLHSVTGCDYKKAKSANFRSFAEAIDEFQPDILTMDANEPDVDHYQIEKMVFFERNGKGAEIFFKELVKVGLKDIYALRFNPQEYVPGEPLAISHMLKGKEKRGCRYDFIFADTDRFDINTVIYDYENAVAASADHAIIVSDMSLR
ncbi:hypothetical protein SAMN02910292_02554 [Lachnospiraceae bacterium XBB2008]|nr:hypothetical protein SAMN02910292_02554 [Lachnospiraceae bacterium XBB2008]